MNNNAIIKVEATFENGDILSLWKSPTHFHKRKPTELYTLSYGEKSTDEIDGEVKDVYMAHQSEYFAGNDLARAVDAFNSRMNSAEPYKATGLGSSIDSLTEPE